MKKWSVLSGAQKTWRVIWVGSASLFVLGLLGGLLEEGEHDYPKSVSVEQKQKRPKNVFAYDLGLALNQEQLLVALKERKAFNKTLLPYTAQYPLDQLQVIAISLIGRNSFNKGANELAKGAARPERREKLCAHVGAQKGWIGRVSTLDSNNEGKGVLSVTIANDMLLTTHNNAFSDVRDKTLLRPSTQVFKKAMALSHGDIVQFDGYAIPDKTDCMKEISLTLEGSMQEPNYIFRFTDLKKIN